MPLREALHLAPAFHERVWGGQRLHPGPNPIGEAWLVYEGNRVVGGPHDGQTLAELVAAHGEALLGSKGIALGDPRFPLLVKILDAHDWLSVQVHPDDQQALQLEGPGHLGKTEAWHILAAEPGAQLICGLHPGTTNEALATAIRAGTVTDLASYLNVTAGDTIFIAAGTLHALGPGLLLYEVQQTSDITYRVFDWDRPLTAGRKLHIDQSLAVTNPAISGEVQHRPADHPGTPKPLVACPYFILEEITGPTTLDTRGESFHALTPVSGEIIISGDRWQQRLTPYESAVIPAACGSYTLTAAADARTLLSRVP